jgi:hypothetical protein
MRFRELAAVTAALLAAHPSLVAAQATGDRAQLIFTVSGAYIDGKGLWSVANQPVFQTVGDSLSFTDNYILSRSVKRTFGAGFSGMYFPGEHVGFTGDAFLLGLGYDDSCRLTPPVASPLNQQVCDDIDSEERSAAAATLSVGAVFRVLSREPISPFARVSVGLLFSNQSSVITEGVTNGNTLVRIYDDSKNARVSPSLALGVGATIPMSRGYHLRWEVRDNIVGIERVTGPIPLHGFEPPHERDYKHFFSVLIGIDVILERNRGRRY